MTVTLETSEPSNRTRFVQIGLGILTVILAIIAIALPGLTLLSLVVLISTILFIVGIEKILSGIFIRHKSRFASIGLGVLTIILAAIALSFPIAAAIVVIYFLGFALMFDGFARIMDGITNTNIRGSIRAFIIAVGVLNVIISFIVFASPLFGAFLAGVIIGASLLIVGIQMITAGITGRQQRIGSKPAFGP